MRLSGYAITVNSHSIGSGDMCIHHSITRSCDMVLVSFLCDVCPSNATVHIAISIDFNGRILLGPPVCGASKVRCVSALSSCLVWELYAASSSMSI